MSQITNPFIRTNDHSFETGCYSSAFEICSGHLPEADWMELQDLAEHADTSLLLFECFTMPDSDAVGFKLIGTPWIDEHLCKVMGYELSTLQAKQAEEAFPTEVIKILTLAAQADVRFLVFDPNAFVLEGLPLFDC